jgi:hypothetical protein
MELDRKIFACPLSPGPEGHGGTRDPPDHPEKGDIGATERFNWAERPCTRPILFVF